MSKALEAEGVEVDYEGVQIRYEKPSQMHRYTIDFLLPNGIVIETKGRFTVEDRKKHLLIKEQYPELDLRFVFSNPKGKINKKSKTTYADWCEKHGFRYAKGLIPKAWLKEKTNRRSLQLAQKFRRKPT